MKVKRNSPPLYMPIGTGRRAIALRVSLRRSPDESLMVMDGQTCTLTVVRSDGQFKVEQVLGVGKVGLHGWGQVELSEICRGGERESARLAPSR